MWMNGWAWLIAAALLAAVELMIPGYVFLGTAIAVALVGLGLLAGITLGPPILLIVTGILSLICWFLLRRTMGVRKGQVRIWDRDINE
ncbi:MAG: hypothetical protein Q4G26_03315 [Paracoccus sp. (in: a-proteobacteria)]|nr:hypothetical protein [Paracoccus sp. (in: a-proteobacteria)]